MYRAFISNRRIRMMGPLLLVASAVALSACQSKTSSLEGPATTNTSPVSYKATAALVSKMKRMAAGRPTAVSTVLELNGFIDAGLAPRHSMR